jgi:hypothetical protein
MSCPEAAIAWVRSVEWLVAADRAVVLHVGADAQLTCVASCWGRLSHLGPLSRDAMAAEAAECGASGVIAVDLRPKMPARSPSDGDRRRHRLLRAHLALHGVAVLDTVLVAPEGGASVTGVLTFPLDKRLSWLQVHTPESRPAGADGEWSHEDAASFLPRGDSSRAGEVIRPPLWGALDP